MRRLLAIFFLLTAPLGLLAQGKSDDWLRVITGEDFAIDVDRTSVILQPDSIIQVQIRTVSLNADSSKAASKVLADARVDRVEFKATTRQYRITPLDALLRTNSTLSAKGSSDKWLSFGKTGARIFAGISRLAPFGNWKLLIYHYSSGEGPTKDDPEELRAMIGKTIVVEPDYLAIGYSNCPWASLDFRSASDKNLSRYGFSLKDFGIQQDQMSIILATCRNNKDYPPLISLFLQTPSKGTLLWDGVLFDIERPPNIFTP